MYQRLLVAVDFSPAANAAVQQAVRISGQARCPLALAHVLTDVREAMLAASFESRQEFFFGNTDKFQRELRKDSDRKLKELAAKFKAPGLKFSCETLLGAPFVELTHAVQKEGYDLVAAGTRGLSKFKQFVLGSTAARLIQNCPAPVWIVRQGSDKPPKTVLAAVDFSDVSARALQHAAWHARQAGAQLLVLHVIDALDVPADLLARVDKKRQSGSFRTEIKQAAKERLSEFLLQHLPADSHAALHISWGDAWREIGRLAEKTATDLVAMGTVGRSGLKGMLLGNTAEKVLGSCNCNILTVKPAEFVSPIAPPFWDLHPEDSPQESSAKKRG